MAKKPILKQLDLTTDELSAQLEAFLGSGPFTELDSAYRTATASFEPDAILTGRILKIEGDSVIVDVGYKSEGTIPVSEFDDPAEIVPGAEVQVLLEQIEDAAGEIILSKRKADRRLNWDRIIQTKKEGDCVSGKVLRKIKGGLLVDIGVPVFLPASQIDIRRTGDISEWIGRDIDAKIIKIDEDRMNIVVSRRKKIEDERAVKKDDILKQIEPGQIWRGIVKNIADFGAFVDLGGIDGLLHITDMSWGRVNHPSEVVNIDDEIEVIVLKVDRERERIALGIKQKEPSPWENVETKYPIHSRHQGEVVNIMSYGAFVKLEEGIEGLVHISEMSWTKRIEHPSQVVSAGDIVEVEVLDIKRDKQEISLGMKQCETNPWDLVEQRYPPGTIVEGVVRNCTNYGAFVEIEEGIDGLLHIHDMSWTRKISKPEEVVKKGDRVRAVVLQVDQEKKRVALGLKQLAEDPWEHDIPERFTAGLVVPGKITKNTNFGVFVELEDGLEGLLHISEIQGRVSPDELRADDRIEVRIIKVDPEERKIGLSLVTTPGEYRAKYGDEPEAESSSSSTATASDEPSPETVEDQADA